MKNIIIIGGGASGLMSAILLARKGAKVTILEHKDRVGKKILMTGNGKCNLSNINDFHGKYYSDDIDKVYSVLERFSANDTKAFFKSIGLYTKEMRDGGVYPVAEQASTVLDLLRCECDRLGVTTVTECEVLGIKPNKHLVDTTTKSYHYDKLIIATGGKSAAVTGSDGSGYKLASSLGHSIIKPLPALVALRCSEKFFKSISGVRAKVNLKLLVDGRVSATQSGELQLTDYGISGIVVFQISRISARALDLKRKCTVSIDFLPFLPEDDMDTSIDKSMDESMDLPIQNWLDGMVNKKIATLICKLEGISPQMHISDLSPSRLKACIHRLKNFEVDIVATNPFENAQTTCGGVPLDEVSPSLESLKCKDVHFAGEILDCDGICGGYNLQWAWASAYVVAQGIEQAPNSL